MRLVTHTEYAEWSEISDLMEDATEVAYKSPCQKSKRGVIIVKDGNIIGRGFNSPFLGECNNEQGYTCREYCEHAEDAALKDAKERGVDVSGARMFHIKVKNGVPVASESPSCSRCANLALEEGILEFVLKHENGYGVYGIAEFHELSVRNDSHKITK